MTSTLLLLCGKVLGACTTACYDSWTPSAPRHYLKNSCLCHSTMSPASLNSFQWGGCWLVASSGARPNSGHLAASIPAHVSRRTTGELPWCTRVHGGR